MNTMIKLIFIALISFYSQTTPAQGSTSSKIVIPKWKLADLESAIHKAEKPTIFNFWATFCKPCIEEIPYFQEIVKSYNEKGVDLILVSVDMPELYPKRIEYFVSKFNFTANVVYLDETNADLFCPVVDLKWSGAIPATLFVNNNTGYRSFFENQLTRQKLTDEIEKMIKE